MIRATTQFTDSEMRVARKNHLRRHPARRLLWPSLGVVYLLWGIHGLSKGRNDAGLDVLVIALGLIFFGLPFIKDWQAGQRIRKSPQFNKVQQWTFTGDTVHAEGEGYTTTVRWDQFLEAVSTRDGHLLYPVKGMYYWIPKSGFETQLGEQEFLQIIRAKTKHTELTVKSH